ncbi:nuclear export factor GLE1 [Paenibacillus sp. oral taxon 786 str. D14]|uniref:YcnI family copper-binding membrane protein n=1 Tax=Paenibacillus sp. oral taxon 786 TaxID=652715 RepID=UPI0001AFD38A|nr:YcnI family protein [Paenibacillus sp. oral taxon 786]EES74199.1 nuclear export factor GLE1 [Paenibacillus sp. oral taxon 786 str. D14]
MLNPICNLKKTFWRYAAGSAIVWVLTFAFFTATAGAHVTVKPSQSAPGAWETYSLKVPVEKDVNTVKVALKIPDGVAFKQYRPLPDWSVELTIAEDGTVTAVTWTAEGAGIGPGEFQQFEFVVQNPGEPAELAWDAFQYYSDGSVVEWTGAEGTDRPHSLTVVSAAEGAADIAGSHTGVDAGAGTTEDAGHDHGSANEGAAANTTESNGSDTEASSAPLSNDSGSGSSAGTTALVLSACALLVSLVALGLALRVRRKHA